MKYAYCKNGRIVWTTTISVDERLIDAGTTEILVDDDVTPDTHYLTEDGVCVQLPERPSPVHTFDYTTKTWVDPRTTTELKATAHTAIVNWRDQQENAGFTFAHAGHDWDGGLIVRQRLQPVLILPALPPGFFWTDAVNEDVPVDMPSLHALAATHEQALVVRGFEIHARQRSMKNALDTMTSEELIDFKPDWA